MPHAQPPSPAHPPRQSSLEGEGGPEEGGTFLERKVPPSSGRHAATRPGPQSRALTPRQDAFVLEYLLDLSPYRAAVRAGYSPKSARADGWRLLRKPHVASAVAAAMAARNKRLELSQDRVLEELARLAFADLRAAMAWGPDGLRCKESGGLSEAEAAPIAEVEERMTKEGPSLRFKRFDKVKALELLMRHMGMLPDKPGWTGNGEKTPPPKVELVLRGTDEK